MEISQVTAFDEKTKNVANQILHTENGNYNRARKLAKTAGGCSINTSLAANNYLKSHGDA